MHIVQLIPELNQGGVERGVVEFNRELVKRGHQSTVISAGGTLARTIGLEGGTHVDFDVCSKTPLTVPCRIRRLKNLFNSLSPDIIHPRSRVPAWLSYFANRSANTPWITTVHGFNSVSKYSGIMVKGDLVIYGSMAIKDYVLSHYNVDESKLRYVPRGVDTDHFDPDKTDRDFVSGFKAKHGLDDRKIISMVGRITEWKGHDCFIRALAKVQKHHPEAIGLIIGGVWHGKEDYLESLKQLAKETGADIRFAGSQTNVREIYALSDLAVSAAHTKPETFGRVAAEALAMNTPVIASAHGGSLDIVRDGENGFFFEPGNDSDLANKIEAALNGSFSNMRAWIGAHFSLQHMTETELAVYRELTER